MMQAQVKPEPGAMAYYSPILEKGGQVSSPRSGDEDNLSGCW